MDFEKIKEKYTRLCTLKAEMDTDVHLRDCIKNLTNEGLMELYNFYDLTEENNLNKTNSGRINYLVREIPSQFLDDFAHMMDEKDRKIIIKLCQNKEVKINEIIVHFMTFGYVYITPSGKFIFPLGLKWFIGDLFM